MYYENSVSSFQLIFFLVVDFALKWESDEENDALFVKQFYSLHNSIIVLLIKINLLKI